ncbi:ilvB operon leader peptide IvbL [Salmonella enterica subsp. enterica]|nr:ilvB operon leader peptide IvbL [Salmonella enterica subsp. enterica]
MRRFMLNATYPTTAPSRAVVVVRVVVVVGNAP